MNPLKIYARPFLLAALAHTCCPVVEYPEGSVEPGPLAIPSCRTGPEIHGTFIVPRERYKKILRGGARNADQMTAVALAGRLSVEPIRRPGIELVAAQG